MNLTTVSMDLEDDQERTRNVELNEFIVRGGKFSYKSIKHVTSAILMVTVFLLSFLSHFFGVYTLIYTRDLLSSLPYTCTADNLCYKMEMGLRGKEKHNKANVSPYLYIYIYCRDTFCSPSPNCKGYWPNEPSIINL